MRLGPVADGDAGEEEDAIAAKSAQPCLLVARHPAVGVGQRRRDGEDQEQREEVGERRRVLERVGALALKKPPPLVPSCLIASCEATGPSAMRLLAALERGDVEVGREVLDHALRDQDQREDDAERQEHVDDAADQIDPEVAERLAAVGAGPRA